MTRLAFVALVALGQMAPLAAYAQQAQRAAPRNDRVSLEGYLDWEQISDPQISPDGKQVVYGRRWVDKINDAWKSSLWIMNADGSRNRFLTEGGQPQWSPDGTRIAFLREGEPRGSQIFVRYMDAEGATTQITRVDKSPADLQWSPDGKTIAFTMSVQEREQWAIRLPSRPEGAHWTPDPHVVTRLSYRRDGTGYVDDGWRHIFTVSASGGTPRQLTDGNWNHANPAWTPDGSAILFTSLRVENAEDHWRESAIYSVNVASGTIATLVSRKGTNGNPTPSPNGKLMAFTGYDWTDDTYHTDQLYVANADGTAPRAILGDLDRTPADLTWATDNTGIYFTAEDHGSSNVYFAPLTGAVKKLTDGPQMIRVTSMTSLGTVAATFSNSTTPADVVVFDVKRPPAAMKPLTEANADVLQGRKLGAVEEINYTSVDNFKIQGWVVKPPDFDPTKKYPLILTIHGGPHSEYTAAFNYVNQQQAAQGYLVLYVNPRGSTGSGSAFGNAIKFAYPSKDFDDLMAGVDTVIGRGYVDKTNLFVYGCSGGGVLTAWTVGHTDRFAAAAVLCPVIDWISFVGTTDGPGWYRNFAKLPWEDPSEHLRRSPLMYVGNVKTPTFLMTGVLDLRTPISQTEEFYEALRLRHVPTAMVRMNGEYHGTSSKPSNWLRTQLYLQSWFEKYGHRTAATTDGSR
jgi:dipeptidyl aminopeptidase/acylaminoacyl peptidase